MFDQVLAKCYQLFVGLHDPIVGQMERKSSFVEDLGDEGFDQVRIELGVLALSEHSNRLLFADAPPCLLYTSDAADE